MLSLSRRWALSLLAALATISAQAEEVKLTDFSIAGPSGLNVVANHIGASWYGAAGQFSGVLNGNSFVTYCVDLPQYSSFGVTYTDYTRVDGATAFGAQKAADLARLVTYAGMTPKYSTDSAMMQAAIWEVVHETGTDYSFTTGDVLASGLDASTQDWLNAFDWSAVKATTATYDVGALVSSTHQDFLITTPIPEPSTYALMAMGLGLVGWASRRGRPQG